MDRRTKYLITLLSAHLVAWPIYYFGRYWSECYLISACVLVSGLLHGFADLIREGE